MTGSSRRWTWVVFGMAVVIIAGGTVAALLIWQSRSSSKLEVLDTGAARDIAYGIIDNTAAIAEGWMAPDLPQDITNLVIKGQESSALLSGEASRTGELLKQVQEPQPVADQGFPQNLIESLRLLSQAQALLEQDLTELGFLFEALKPLDAADISYQAGRETLLAAVDSHNQAVAAGTTDFAAARQEAGSAIASLRETEAALGAVQLEGLELGSALSAPQSLAVAAQRFIEACQKGEANDAEGHNSLMPEAQSALSSFPGSILPAIDIAAWLRPQLEVFIQEVLAALEDVQTRLNAE